MVNIVWEKQSAVIKSWLDIMGAVGCEPETWGLPSVFKRQVSKCLRGLKTNWHQNLMWSEGSEGNLSTENFLRSSSQHEYDFEPLTTLSCLNLGALSFSEGDLGDKRGCVSGSLGRAGMSPHVSPIQCFFQEATGVSPWEMSSPRGTWWFLFPLHRVNHLNTCVLSPLGTHL